MNKKQITPEEKLSRARTWLVLNAPFFGTVALTLPSILDESARTACTDGTRIRFAPSFLEKLEVRQVVGLIVHEVLHVILKHPLVRGHRDPSRWNQACDYAINLICKDGGYYLPEGGLLDEKYRDLSAFQIYEILSKKQEEQKQEQQQQQQQEQGDDQDSSGSGGGDEESDEKSDEHSDESGSGDSEGDESEDSESSGDQAGDQSGDQGDEQSGDQSGDQQGSTGWGDIEDPKDGSGNQLTEAQAQELSDKIDSTVATAEATARLAGSLPAGLARLLGEARKPLVNWRDELRRHLTERTTDDWSWRRPSRRHRDFILPSLCAEGAGVIAVTVDTSGSIREEQYQQAIAEVAECAQTLRAKVFIGSCDTQHYGFEEYLDGDPLPKLRGGGGTDFDDASEKLESLVSDGHEVKVHLFITDGETNRWGREVCPTVWAIHGNTTNITPPYGERVNIPLGV